MLSTAAVPEPVISTAAPCRRIERVHRQQPPARLVLQVEELALAVTQIRLQQAAPHALGQRHRPGLSSSISELRSARSAASGAS